MSTGLPRLIKPSLHFVEDSLIAAGLFFAPIFLPLSPLGSALSWAGAAYVGIYNNLTDRPGSLWPLLTEWHHRILDTAGLVANLVVPWFLSGIDRTFFLTQGVLALLLNLITDFTPDPRPAKPFAPRFVRWLVTTAGASIGIAFLFRAATGLVEGHS
jgi:hypothetical protein